MKINWKGLLNLLLVISIIVYIIIYTSNKSSIIYDEEYYKNKQIELIQQRDSLEQLMFFQSEKIKTYENNIDSLESLKPKIKYVYVQKYKKIDTASIADIISDFEDIFAGSNIK